MHNFNKTGFPPGKQKTKNPHQNTSRERYYRREKKKTNCRSQCVSVKFVSSWGLTKKNDPIYVYVYVCVCCTSNITVVLSFALLQTSTLQFMCLTIYKVSYLVGDPSSNIFAHRLSNCCFSARFVFTKQTNSHSKANGCTLCIGFRSVFCLVSLIMYCRQFSIKTIFTLILAMGFLLSILFYFKCVCVYWIYSRSLFLLKATFFGYQLKL